MEAEKQRSREAEKPRSREAEKQRSRDAEAAGGVAVGAWSNRTPPSEGGAGKEKRWKPKAES